MKYATYLFFGSPGSGKGTHGRILGTVPGFCHLACGDVFRSLDMHTPLGRAFADYSAAGKLVPDGLVMELWQSQIQAMIALGKFNPRRDRLILDGIPRNLSQAGILDDYLDVIKVFHLTCSNDDELVSRMRRRALKDNRMDDANEETIRRRLQVYRKETLPVLEHYGTKKTVTVFTAQSPSEVFAEILTKINLLEAGELSTRQTEHLRAGAKVC
ncbi:MAG: nucleoside monophosphate kinase [Verrucomicrobiales bacterium]|jgi:adenylate kinase|nr:nucleoside monophosphate kinase [Verrucomicrobiales bacterium]